MKHPNECENMADIRNEIDRIDRQIIGYIGNRYQYVKAAAKFKTDKTAVKAPERFAAMLLQRRKWAEEEKLSPEVIEKMYKELVNYFIAEELKEWGRKPGG
jgi:isochorismate pyruvate lyase